MAARRTRPSNGAGSTICRSTSIADAPRFDLARRRKPDIKGAPEVLVSLCKHVETADGLVVLLEEEKREGLAWLTEGKGGQGMRLLGVVW